MTGICRDGRAGSVTRVTVLLPVRAGAASQGCCAGSDAGRIGPLGLPEWAVVGRARSALAGPWVGRAGGHCRSESDVRSSHLDAGAGWPMNRRAERLEYRRQRRLPFRPLAQRPSVVVTWTSVRSAWDEYEDGPMPLARGGVGGPREAGRGVQPPPRCMKRSSRWSRAAHASAPPAVKR